MVPLGNPAAAQISNPYIARDGSSSRALITSCVGNVMRGPERLGMLLLYLAPW